MIYIFKIYSYINHLVGYTFLFQMIYILSNWNSLSYNYLRYLPSGIIPQHKGFQQPRWIFKSKDYHISRLHNYVCKRIYCECVAKLLKINKNKDFICYRFRKKTEILVQLCHHNDRKHQPICQIHSAWYKKPGQWWNEMCR